MTYSRKVLAFVALVISATATPAVSDYGHLTLFQLLTGNEVAVRGVVRGAKDESYRLESVEDYRTMDAPPSLEVVRFDTYPPDTRSGSFAEGQSIVLFAAPAKDGSVRPIGRMGEGELIRDEGFVFVRAMARPPTDLVRSTVPGGAYSAYRIDAEIFDKGVAGFYECYRPQAPGKIERICSDDARDRYRGSSWLAEHLVGIAERVIGTGD